MNTNSRSRILDSVAVAINLVVDDRIFQRSSHVLRSHVHIENPIFQRPHFSLQRCCLGVASTVPVQGGVGFLLYGFCQCILSLNASVFCRYTIMHYIVSVYMQVADCTIGFLLYLDAYRLP